MILNGRQVFSYFVFVHILFSIFWSLVTTLPNEYAERAAAKPYSGTVFRRGRSKPLGVP
jgi:preprotein translocase subunit SecY